MGKLKHLQTTTRLGLPLLAIAIGFSVHNLTAAIIVWLLALTAVAINVFLMFQNIYEDTPVNNILGFISLYVLGCVFLPFALAGAILWGLYKLVCIILSPLASYVEAIQRIFAILVLNISILGLALSIILVEDNLVCVASVIACLTALIYSAFLIRKQIAFYQNNYAMSVLAVGMLILTIGASVAAIMHPEFVSLEWGGLMLAFWLVATIINAAVITAVSFLIISVMLFFGHS